MACAGAEPLVWVASSFGDGGGCAGAVAPAGGPPAADHGARARSTCR
jgi:hypothetical protein